MVMSDEMRTRLHELVMHAANYRSVMYLVTLSCGYFD